MGLFRDAIDLLEEDAPDLLGIDPDDTQEQRRRAVRPPLRRRSIVIDPDRLHARLRDGDSSRARPFTFDGR